MPRPMPPLPPVTTATRWLKSKFGIGRSFSPGRGDHSAGHRLRRAGRRRESDRQTVQRAHRQISESLRLERVRRPADRIGGLHRRRREPLGQHPHQVGLRAPPPPTIQPCGARGRLRHDARDRRGGERRQRRGAVGDARNPAGRYWQRRRRCGRATSAGLGRRTDASSTRATKSSSTRPRAAVVAVVVERRAGARAHEIVDQRVARAGVAGDRIAAVDKGDVGDAADIEHRDRMRPRRACAPAR